MGFKLQRRVGQVQVALRRIRRGHGLPYLTGVSNVRGGARERRFWPIGGWRDRTQPGRYPMRSRDAP